MQPTDTHLTLGVAALRLGVQWHHLDRLAKSGKIPVMNTGRFRLVAVADLDAVREACRARGLLQCEAGACK